MIGILQRAAVLALLCVSAVSAPAAAGWIEVTGKVKAIATYAHTDVVLIILDNQPTGPVPAGCSLAYLAIDGAMPAERRQALLSQLVTA